MRYFWITQTIIQVSPSFNPGALGEEQHRAWIPNGKEFGGGGTAMSSVVSLQFHTLKSHSPFLTTHPQFLRMTIFGERSLIKIINKVIKLLDFYTWEGLCWDSFNCQCWHKKKWKWISIRFPTKCHLLTHPWCVHVTGPFWLGMWVQRKQNW